MNIPYHYSHFILLFSLVSLPCESNERVILNVSQDYGGEALAIDSTNQIQLGAGLTSTIGFSRSIENSNISYLVSLGYKINAAKFSGGAVLFTTYPVNVLVHYSQASFNVGVGFSQHINPKITYNCSAGSQCSDSQNNRFNNSLGTILDFNYAMSAKSFFGIRYTLMKYTGIKIEDLASNQIRDSLDVSHIGIQLGYEF